MESSQFNGTFKKYPAYKMTSFILLKYLDKLSGRVPFTSWIIHLAISATAFSIYNFIC